MFEKLFATVPALAIEAEDAQRAGALGFMARAMVQATLPHSPREGCAFTRKNGNFTLSIMAPPDIGLPYGSIPRLLMAWITTEAVRTKSPVLELGPSLSSFMAQLDLTPTGGRWGSIPRLRKQMESLFSSSVSCSYKDESRTSIRNVIILDAADLWWDAKTPGQAALWRSTLALNKKFFDEVISRPIPVDIRTLKALKQSPMALDVYCWLTYRMSYLHKSIAIPWPALKLQFGSDYKRARDFKAAFVEHLQKVLVHYPAAKVEPTENGLLLKPSRPHIAPAFHIPLLPAKG